MINSTESNLFVLVQTIKEEHHQKMDMRRLSENALKTLRTKDPFMYHSIPEVHRATFTLQEVEYAKIISSQASSIVTRKSRVSTECHPSQLMEEFLHNNSILLRYHVYLRLFLPIPDLRIKMIVPYYLERISNTHLRLHAFSVVLERGVEEHPTSSSVSSQFEFHPRKLLRHVP